MLLGYWVLHKLYSKHHAFASNVSDSRCFLLCFFELFDQIISHFLRILWQFFILENFEHFQAKPALERTSTISVEEIVGEGRHDFSACCHGSQWISICHCLSCDDNVRLHTMMLETPHAFTDSAEPCLHFVRNYKASIFSSHLGKSLEVAIRERHNPTHAHDRFSPDTSYLMIAR